MVQLHLRKAITPRRRIGAGLKACAGVRKEVLKLYVQDLCPKIAEDDSFRGIFRSSNKSVQMALCDYDAIL